MELTAENIKKVRRLILFAAIACVGLWKYEVSIRILSFVWTVVFPFILGGAIAFVLNIPMDFIQRHLFPADKGKKHRITEKLARPVSIFLVLLFLAAVVCLILFVMLPRLGSTLTHLGERIEKMIPEIREWMKTIFHNNRDVMRAVDQLALDWETLMDAGLSFFGTGAGNMLDSTISAARSIVNGVTTFFIAFAFSIYILAQKEKLKRQAEKVLFAFVRRGRAEAAIEVLALTYRTFSHFLAGQCVEAVILGLLFAVSMMLFRLPYALLIGIIIGFTALVPVFGAFVGCAAGTVLIFMADPGRAPAFVLLFLVLQQIEGNLIYPHVVGNSVGLPSIWVLAAVSVGARLMGIVGMLVFIPVVSVLYALFREVVYLKLRKREVEGE